MTQFCKSEVKLSTGHILVIDGNSKITASNGTYDEPVPNAFSLPHIIACPGATETCKASCYVHGLKKYAPEVYATYEANLSAVQDILLDKDVASIAAEELGVWIRDNCSGGFRWHVSGDIISHKHAQWIAEVSWYARVMCWIYTRSFEFVSTLVGGSPANLEVNLSSDSDNHSEAMAIAAKHGVRVCHLVDASGAVPDGLPDGSVLFPDYALRGRDMEHPTDHVWWMGLAPRHRLMVCPTDFFGQSEQHRCGPCKKCLR